MRFSASKIDFSVLSMEAEMDASISFILAISISVIVIACTYTSGTRDRIMLTAQWRCEQISQQLYNAGTSLRAAIQRGGNFERVRIDAELSKLRTVPSARRYYA